MKKAIVFAGGGSKGAYQIGVWKALEELGEHFDIACGTSIGAINAFFYVQKDLEAAREMWSTITIDAVMANGLNLEKSVGGMLAQRDQLRHFIKDYINCKGADVTPLHESIQNSYMPGKFASSEIDFALMMTEFPSMNPVTVTKGDMLAAGENGWKYIAASAAAWPVFPWMSVDSKNYVDGGYYDNVPVAAAVRAGAQKVLIVYLKPDDAHGSYEGHPFVECIRPTRDLGTFLNFDRQVIDRSLCLGYTDAMKHFGKYHGRMFTVKNGGEEIKAFAEKFIGILTLDEACFVSHDKYHFQMGSRDEGCIPLLAESSFEGRRDTVSLFVSALEAYLTMLGFDDEKELDFPSLIAALRASVSCANVKDDFSGEKAFENITSYITEECDPEKADKKLLSSDRHLLIACAMAKALF